MDLKDFIKTSLIETIAAVEEAQNQLKTSSSRGAINPQLRQRTEISEIQNVEFDIAVTASNGTAGTAKAGIVVASIGLGGTISDNHQNSSVSRIKFAVPIRLSSALSDANER